MFDYVRYLYYLAKDGSSALMCKATVKRINSLVVAVLLLLSLISSFGPHSTSASQLQARSIKMSTSSNASGAATTSYSVLFTTQSTYTGRGIIIEFCAENPIIMNTTCTVPTNFTAAAATITTNSAPMNSQTWTVTSLNSGRTVALTQATGVSFTNSTIADFTLNNIQNPTSAVGTFYARIYTYSATAGASSYTLANPDNGATHVDEGGVALSTSAPVTVTTKVQETLTFCVYTGVNCAAGVSGMYLGDSNYVLSSTTTAYLTSTNATTPLTAKLDVASNATNGVKVNAKVSGTLTSGSNTIASIGNTCTADSSTATVEQFGFRVIQGTLTSTNYYCSGSSTTHAFNLAALTGTYGDEIVKTTAPSVLSVASVDFVGKSSTTTKAGIYSMTMTFIATGYY